MPKGTTLAVDAERAHERTLDVVRELGPAERVERLDNITVGFATARHPQHLVTFQAEILAAFAEIIKKQGRRISELEKARNDEAPAAGAKQAGQKTGR